MDSAQAVFLSTWIGIPIILWLVGGALLAVCVFRAGNVRVKYQGERRSFEFQAEKPNSSQKNRVNHRAK